MRKSASFFLTAALLLSLAGCAKTAPQPPQQDMIYASSEIQFSSTEQQASDTGPEQPESSSSEVSSSSGKPQSSSSSEVSSSSSKPQSSSSSAAGSQVNPTAPAQEMRAVWFSYLDLGDMVKNKTEKEFENSIKRAFNQILADGYNTVFFQVRPFGDALYDSQYFPWSHILTGTEGTDPGYDPLEIAIKAAHERDMKLEAWINPYRIRTPGNAGKALDKGSVAYDWLEQGTGDVLEYKGGIYFNPGSEQARELIVSGVEELVENYAVDGIHFDDYFYPTTDPAFDADTYAAYKKGGGTLSQAAWRRQNVDMLVKETYAAIKRIDSGVVFGISPQGNNDINYNQQYIDTQKWLSSSGYVDYICPQVYYGFENETCPYSETVAYWNSLIQNKNIALYVGLSASKIGLEDKWAGAGKNEWVENSNMLSRMVAQARRSSQYQGFSMYSYRSLYAPASSVAAQVEKEKDALDDLMS